MMKKNNISPKAFELDGRMPLAQAIPLGLQHVLAMFVGNLTPLLIITGACGLVGNEFAELQLSLLQNAMMVAGVVTLVQLFALGPIGGRVPIIMGTSSGFIGVFNSVAATMGGGVTAYGAIMGASLIGGLFEGVLGLFLKPLRKLLPSVVTGTVVLSIGLSLISVGINTFGGGQNAPDFGSVENLLLALFVLIVILVFKSCTSGFTSASSILIGIIFGYIAAFIMGLVLPTTGIGPDGAEYTKAWVLNWDKVANAAWFAVPDILPVKPVFDMRAVIPVIIMFIVTAVETVGDISGVMEGGLGREATDKELSGGVICDGIGSSFAALFGVLPNTSFSQNVGLVAMTKIVNRFALATGAVFLILCGLCPKLGALVSIMPQSVLGGAAVMMFSSIVVSGIQLITKTPLTPRNLTIVSVALGVGYGMGANSAILANTPVAVQLIFGGSGIVPAAAVAIILNLVLPKDNLSGGPEGASDCSEAEGKTCRSIDHVSELKRADLDKVISSLPDSVDELWVFGSAVTSYCKPESDLDVCVVGDSISREDRRSIAHAPRNAMDLLVVTHEEFERESKDINSVYHAVASDGLLVYRKGEGIL